jgi:hypothetical protein
MKRTYERKSITYLDADTNISWRLTFDWPPYQPTIRQRIFRCLRLMKEKAMTYEIDPRTGFQIRKSGSEVPQPRPVEEPESDLGLGALRPGGFTLADAKKFSEYQAHKKVLKQMLKDAEEN